MVLDTIIIGAGAMGSSAAYWLSKYQNVALIEQSDLLHTNGSSHGQSRIIRKTYQEIQFANMMPKTYKLWEDIENETNTSVYTKTGGMDFGEQNSEDMKRTLDICETNNLEYEVLDAKQIMDRFPAYNISEDIYGIFQPETGILNATKSVDMLQQQANHQGAQLLSNHKVTKIYPGTDIVTIETSNGSFKANNVVITSGSWINQVLHDFDLKVQTEIWKTTIAYWKVNNPKLFKPEKFPVFINWAADKNHNYGFPVHERSNYVKIAPHMNEKIEKVSDNDGINEINNNLLDDLSDFIKNTFNGISDTPTHAETCLYTMTPDENFIIDFIPGYDNIVIAGGFSGHGFKFTSLIGQILQKMVMKEEIESDLSHFKIDNFLA